MFKIVFSLLSLLYNCTGELKMYFSGNYQVLLILTSGAIKYFPISSQIKAYSTLVNPAPYLLPGSDSLGKNKFHNPAALALL